MPSIKYKYDKETATFIPEKRSPLKYIINILLFLFSTIIFGLLIAYFVFPVFFNKNTSSNKELSDMKTEYNIMLDRLNEIELVLTDIKKRDNNLYRNYFNLSSNSDASDSTFINEDGFVNYRYGKLMKLTSRKLNDLSHDVVTQSKSIEEVLKIAKKKEDLFDRIPAIQPLPNKDMKRIASGFGLRIHPILKIGKMHWGLDFKAESGTPIYATANAIVESAGIKGGYGKTVVLNHGSGYKTLYAHMSRLKAVSGQSVTRGDVIGYVGSTGLSSGPHLHYEVSYNENKINPITFFSAEVSPEQLKKLYEESEKSSFSFD